MDTERNTTMNPSLEICACSVDLNKIPPAFSSSHKSVGKAIPLKENCLILTIVCTKICYHTMSSRIVSLDL